MGLRRIVSSDAASEQQILLKATQAIFDLQQLQGEFILGSECGLPSMSYEGFIGRCLALPVNERLRLLNQQLDVLRQRRQNFREK